MLYAAYIAQVTKESQRHLVMNRLYKAEGASVNPAVLIGEQTRDRRHLPKQARD
jgi:hypothetical protein